MSAPTEIKPGPGAVVAAWCVVAVRLVPHRPPERRLRSVRRAAR